MDIDQSLRDLESEYLNFLDDDLSGGSYNQHVKDMINKKDFRLIININDLRKKVPKRCESLLSNAFEELPAFQRALKSFISAADPTYSKEHEEFFIGFKGSFGNRHLTPRTLTSYYLGNIVCVEGIVTKCSLVRPKVVRSVHYCPATKKTLERRYTDISSFDAFPSTSAYPTKDEDGNLLETEFGLSTYKDHQTFSIQEMPEKAPVGQLPRSVDIIVENDLVDSCKPGDRIQVIGTYRCLPSKRGGYTSGIFKTVLLANNIQLLNKELSPQISAEDVSRCKKFSKEHPKIFELLSRSLAPSIHGNEYIKKAVLCLLLGGVEKVLPNGTRLRGDINVLLLGDPSVAKSQLLRYVLHTAPCAIPTTGRGSSGVGLTAAVTTDQETGDRRLEAGAMVLADRGVVCIDEFDKMSDIDRTAIHEVMEQGRVTVAKAGIHAKLNARCSVLAAANPVYGRYDQYKTPMKNIGLQDSLLSRFDLLFIMLDMMDPESDKLISDHVMRMHRYRAPGEMDGEASAIHTSADLLSTSDSQTEDSDKKKNTEIPIFEKFDALLHGSRARSKKVVSIQFMKKYVHIAKGLKPTLTKEACEAIAEDYARLRTMDMGSTDVARTQPVTARTLETLIRLSTAHAKARMAKTVDLRDAKAAIELVEFALFKKVAQKPRKRNRSDDEESDEETPEVNGHAEAPKSKKPRTKDSRDKPKPGEEGYDPYDFDMSGGEEEPSTVPARTASTEASAATTTSASTTADESASIIPEERMKVFRGLVSQLFKERYAQSLPLADLTQFLTERHTQDPFTPEEINLALSKMMDANQVMIADEIVFLI